MSKKHLLTVGALCLNCMVAFAASDDVKCSGILVNEEGEPIIGATISIPGTQIVATTDIDGNFTITAPSGKKVRINYIGYKPVELVPAAELGQIALEIESQMLQDVVVTQSIARTRRTPVAIAAVDAATIEAKLSNQEFPEVLKTTPGVYATKQGGGYGDAKINMRGFKSANVAALINGIPVNDMEWGGIYWSNWAGLSDVTAQIQTQRGLGASIVSVPSVGGTINVTTKSLDVKRGGTVFYGMGNDGLNQYGFSASTGMMDNGWAVTILGSRKWGDGYIQGTPFNAYTYFLNVSKRINEQHQLSLTAFGSPQTHYKRSDGLTVMGWQEVNQYMNGESMYRYNATFGYDNEGQVRSSNKNVYHKPQISLSHIWQINEKSSLSSSVYASFASGYGYSGQGRGTYNGTSITYANWYGSDTQGKLNTLFRRPDGTFDYGAIQDMNAASTTGSNMVMSKSGNSHTWVGLVSTYKNEILKGLNLTAGIDMRYYIGYHKNTIVDLYDGEYYMDDSTRGGVNAANNAAAADPNWKYQKLGIGDVVYRNYNGYTLQEGAFAQLEYSLLDNRMTAVLAGSVSNTSYWRRDFLYYDKEHEKSETVNFMAGTIKGGVNYNINRYNNVYVNGGYITRAPFFSGGAFLQATTSNATNPNAVNEKVGSFEIGYEYHSPIFTATLNGYYTKWMDQTATRSGSMSNDERYYFNMEGVDARHMGVEVNFTYRPTRWLELFGMLSLGDWKYDSNATGYFYNNFGQPIAETRNGTLASGIFAEDHAKATLNQKGRRVGDSAQTTGALGVNVRPLKGWRIGLDWNFTSRLYSDFTLSSSDYQPGAVINVGDAWRVPGGNQLDLSVSYRFKIGGLDATIFGNVNNLCNYNYIMDATTPATVQGTWQNAYKVYYSFGRTYSARLKVAF